MSSKLPEPTAVVAVVAAGRPWSLAARLTAWYAVSAFLLVVGATIFLYWILVANLGRKDELMLANKVHILRKVLSDRPEELAALRQEVEYQRNERGRMTILVRVLDRNLRLVLESPGMDAEAPVEVFPAAVSGEPQGAVTIDAPSGRSFRIIAADAVAGSSSTPTHVLQLAVDRTFEKNLLTDYRRSLALVLGAALVLCAGIGYWIARRGLRPIRQMATAAGRVSSATLDQRLDLRGLPAELSQLAETFNAMLCRLEDSFQRLARFSADIAHELRTPVNNLRGEAEVALGKARSLEEYADVLSSVLEECGRLASLIDNLLFLARAESPETQISRERVAVAQELETVRRFYEGTATEAGVHLHVQADAALSVDVDRGLLHRALGNLVANALAHTPAGGAITLSATAKGADVQIAVTDTGRGIAAQHLPFVFDRFYRADQARSTASGRLAHVGLGLALVKSIAAVHRGSVSIDSQVDRGTRVVLSLPGGVLAKAMGPAGSLASCESKSAP